MARGNRGVIRAHMFEPETDSDDEEEEERIYTGSPTGRCIRVVRYFNALRLGSCFYFTLPVPVLSFALE